MDNTFVTTIAEPCAAPTGLSSANVDHNSADLSWTAQTVATYEYTVDQTATAPLVAGTATTGTTYTASGLSESTVYYLHVRTECANGEFSPWTTLSFTTEEEILPCNTPSGVSALNIGTSSADLTWSTQSGIAGFEYVLNQTAGNPTAGIASTMNNAFAATALTASTTYHFHVRTNCGNGNFSPWTTLTFTTLSTVGINDHTEIAFTAYPNPSNGKVFISGQTQGLVTLFNLKGQSLVTVDLGETTVFDLSAYESGVYILSYSNGDAVSTVKLIKE